LQKFRRQYKNATQDYAWKSSFERCEARGFSQASHRCLGAFTIPGIPSIACFTELFFIIAIIPI
jgi:hypothetical protein